MWSTDEPKLKPHSIATSGIDGFSCHIFRCIHEILSFFTWTSLSKFRLHWQNGNTVEMFLSPAASLSLSLSFSLLVALILFCTYVSAAQVRLYTRQTSNGFCVQSLVNMGEGQSSMRKKGNLSDFKRGERDCRCQTGLSDCFPNCWLTGILYHPTFSSVRKEQKGSVNGSNGEKYV